MFAMKAPKRLDEWAYHEIKQLILNNQLKPGQTLLSVH